MLAKKSSRQKGRWVVFCLKTKLSPRLRNFYLRASLTPTLSYLLVYPLVRFFHALFEWPCGLPAKLFKNKLVVGVSTSNAQRPFYMLYAQLFAANTHNHFSKTIYRYHLFRADINRAYKIYVHEPADTFETLVYV